MKGSFNRNSACGAVVETPRFSMIEAESGRSNKEPNFEFFSPVRTDMKYRVRRGTAKSWKLGPPSFESNWSATASRLSRIASASSRRRFMRKKLILRVGRQGFGRRFRALLIGGRKHDEPLHCLNRPSRLHKPFRKKIEQFRMRRPRTPFAEIVGSSHDPFAKVMLPQAIDQHTRGQWVIGPSEPSSQLQPPAALVDGRLVSTCQYFWEASRHNGAKVLGITANENVGILEPFVF